MINDHMSLHVMFVVAVIAVKLRTLVESTKKLIFLFLNQNTIFVLSIFEWPFYTGFTV